MKFRLSCNGKNISEITWADVEKFLPQLKKEAFFRLAKEPEPQNGPSFLEIESENGYYMPGIFVRNGPDRDFVNPNGRDKEDVPIGGYDRDAMSVTQDFDLIVSMIKEFFETGDVSGDC